MNYRIYILNHRFQILEAHDFEAPDDLPALQRGYSLAQENPVEIWQKERLVARIGLNGGGAPGRSFQPPANVSVNGGGLNA